MAGALTAAIAAAFSGGAAVVTDDYFEYTTLLLPGNGTNGAQNNTFLDGSTNNFTITRNGNTTQGTFSPFSQTGWGNYFDGTGDSIYASSANTANAMGTGDWTIEASVYKTNSTEGYVFDTLALTGGSTDAIRISISSSGAVYFYKYSTLLTSGGSIALNTWNHIAVVRQSQTIKIYLNGTQVNTTYSDTGSNYTCGTNRPLVGINGYDIASDPFQGYISNLRAVKGVAVYTGNFTPPTSPLAATQSAGTNISAITGTQTSLLTCQSNRFIDNSSNNFTITRNGDTRVVAFSPFNPTASWSAATNGGSGYFDGSGDYLSAASNAALGIGSGNFTIEFWINFSSVSSYPVVFDFRSAQPQAAPTIYLNNDSRFNYLFNSGTAVAFGPNPLIVGTWYHLAWVRSGTTHTIYVNGQSQTTFSDAAGVTSSALNIAARQAVSVQDYFNGYISDFRFVKGTAVYTANFTPPTAPLTAITNTSLLLNFTNAGVYDATSKNDLETVGNAQISTAISAKWGSGSMAFDGTGDWLAAPTSILPQFGTGDFTIEFWWYPNSLATAQQIISNTNDSAVTGSGEFVITYNTSLGLRFYINAGAVDIQQGSTTGWTTGQWYYVAAVRSGNTLTLYRNGSSIASGSVTGVTIGANVPFYIGGEPTQPTSINGYLQDVRITKGYARTVTTSPTAAFPTL